MYRWFNKYLNLYNPIQRKVFFLITIFLFISYQVFPVLKTSTGTNWGTSNNWSPIGVPLATDDVIINSNMAVSLNAVCRSLTVNSSRTLTINSTRSVTVGTGGVVNNGTILLVTGTSTTGTNINIAGNFSNNASGILNATNTYSVVRFNGSSAQSFTNNGTVTSTLRTLMLDNTSGLTLLGNNGLNIYQVNLSTGTITNSNQITLGTGGTSTCVVQVGSGGTSSPRGYFDKSPTFNLGTNGIQLLYTNASANYSTSFEIPFGGNNISYLSVATSNKTVALQSDITITSSYATGLDLVSGNLSIGDYTLNMQGGIGTGLATLTGGTTSNITFSGNTATSLPAVTGGLGNLTFNTTATISIIGGVTVNGTLNLTLGTVSNQSNLTMATGTTIVRSDGSLINAPVFAGTVNLTYSGSSPITTDTELPVAAGVLSNLTTNTGGVIQGAATAVSTNLLTENFTNLNNWTGDIGTSNAQFRSVSSSYAGGTPNETRYIYGNSQTTYFTNSIYCSVNTMGFSAIDIEWKQYINDYDGLNFPYVIRVQSATSPSGPWTGIYSISPATDTGPNMIKYSNITANVGGTFYIRFLIEGYTWGVDYWYIDDLIINGISEVSSTCTLNGTLDLTNGTYTIGENSLVINGNKSGSNSIIGGTTSNLSVGGAGSNLSLPTITNGLGNFTINRANGATLNNSLTVNQTLTLSNGSLSIGANTLTLLGDIIKTSGTLTGGNSSNIIFSGIGASTTLPSVSLNNLTINRSNGIELGGLVNVDGTLNLNSGTLTIGANALTISGNSPIRTSGYINAGNSGATLVFTNTSVITLPVSVFTGNVYNLTISGVGGITSPEDFTIDGILNLQSANPSATLGLLDMFDGSADKTLTMGINASTIGMGDVTGIVKRTSFLANTYYTMGNQYTTVSFQCDVSYPTVIQVNISIGAAPTWKTESVKRVYDFMQTGGNTCRATITTHYLDSELNGNNENLLSQFTYGTPGPPAGLYEWGKSNSNSTQNWVSISNIDISNFPTSFNTLQNTLANTLNAIYIWDGSESTDWNTAANWSTNVVPVITSEVIIPDALTTLFDPILPANTEIQSLNIQSGGILNSVGSELLTINGANGAWNNSGGTFNASSSTVIFTNANATIAGTTSFYNITIGAGGVLTPETNSYVMIAGTLINNGILRSGLQHNTIEYNGSNQTIVFPNGTEQSYYNLIISGSGSKAMPGSTFNVLGDFEIAGTATAVSASEIQVSGSFTVGSNTSFNTNSYNFSVGGNLNLNGTFTTTGSSVTLTHFAANLNVNVAVQ